MSTPPRRVAPQSPLYFGSADASTPSAELIAALEGSLSLSFTQMTDDIADSQVLQSTVTQYQADLSIAWSQLTATPTTLAGYGITDAYTKTASDARFAAIAGPFPWANVSGTPTTLAGYGISDGITAAAVAASYAPLSSPTFTGTVTGTFVGNITGNVTGNTSGSSGSCTGNALTATTLATARAINGVNFDGSAPITVTAAATTLTGTTLNATVVTSSLTSVGTLTSLTTSGAITLTTAAGKIIPGATSISHRNHADSADNLLISDAGLVTVRAGLTVTTGALTVTGGTIQMSGAFARINAGTSALQIRDNTGSNIIFSVASATLIADYWSLEVASNAAIGVLPNNYTNWYGLHIFDPVMFTGKTITNDYGLYIESVAVGTTLNYAIYTNAGLVRFGGAVQATSSLTVTGAFGCNGTAAQTAFAGGGAAPAGGTGTAAGGWDTAAHRDAAITLLNNIYTMAKNNGLMT